MSKQKSKQLLILIDGINLTYLICWFVGITLSFSIFYFVVSKYSRPNGLVSNIIQSDHTVSPADALYFSIITETTLGYGDITPVGYSRACACVQVILGLAFAGIIVAKITSAHSRQRRHDAMMTEGYWIEPCEGDNEFLVTFSQIYLDGDVLRYNGNNYNESGIDQGFYRSKLFDSDGTMLRFYYTNTESSTKHFEEGIINVNFIKEPGSKVYNKHVSTNVDVGKIEKSEFIGFRATEKETEIFTGDDNEKRSKLVLHYKKIFYNHDLKKTKGLNYHRDKIKS